MQDASTVYGVVIACHVAQSDCIPSFLHHAKQNEGMQAEIVVMIEHANTKAGCVVNNNIMRNHVRFFDLDPSLIITELLMRFNAAHTISEPQSSHSRSVMPPNCIHAVVSLLSRSRCTTHVLCIYISIYLPISLHA